MSGLETINPEELAVIATLLGVAPSKTLSSDELNVLGNFLVAIGSIMLTIAAQEEFLKAHKEGAEKDTQKQIQELKEQLQNLQQLLPPQK